MGCRKGSIISLFIAMLGLGGQGFGCPALMTIYPDPNAPVNVGQTVTFTAQCDSPIQGYEWIFPDKAYSVSGQGTGQSSCKFSPASGTAGYKVQLRFKFNGNWYGCSPATVTVNSVSGPWYVRSDGNDQANGQTWETAFQNVQTAIDSASDYDEIVVAEGTYRETISLKGKQVTVRSADPDNWSVVQNAIINGHGQGAVVFFEGSETSACQLKGITVMGGGISYEDPLNDYLEGRWELDETTGTAVPDSKNEHNGEFKPTGGGPVWDSDGGRVAGCLSFDGDDYVEMSDYYGIGGTQARTTSAWIKLSPGSSGGTILSYGGSAYRASWLFMVNGNNKLQLGVNSGNIIGDPVLTADRWYHVAAVLDDWTGDGLKVNDLRLYIDGEQVAGAYVNPNEALTTGNTYPVRIGTHISVSNFFNGRIDDVRIYSKALTETEIRSLVGDVGKVAHWKMDNGSGNTATDSSGNGFDGTLTGNPAWQEGKLGSCLSFDGDDHVVVSGYTGISGGQPRTVCAWIQTNQTSEGMILTYGTTGAGKRWMLFVNGDNHKLQLGVNGGNTYSAQVIADGQWHHVVALLDPPVSGPAKVQNLRLYIDGQIAERFYTNPNQVINTEIAANYPVRIGANQTSSGGGLGGYFNGKIDDVRLYDRAITEAEIRAIYSQGGGICGNGTQATISNCVIRNNATPFDGGGIWNVDGNITNCFILNNKSQANGGGLANCDGLVANCVITENEAAWGGALSLCDAGIVNCTLVSNATESGGILNACNGTITNCILWNNTGTLLADSVTPAYSCYPGASGNNNTSANPNFRSLSDLRGPDQVWGTNDDGLILQSGSPCMDAGNDPAVPSSITEDITGRNRYLDGDHDQTATVDMGAYEMPRIWYVDDNMATSGDGKSWATAKKTIQEGINVSQDGDVVLVEDGIYTGGGYTGPRNRDLDFEGKAITVRSLNGPDNCIIDCNGLLEEPHRGFYFHSNEGADSIVCGFTIQNGYVNSSHPNLSFGNGSGGAIACGKYILEPNQKASPTIMNCIFKNNQADQYGGGLFCAWQSNPTIVNCVFNANQAGNGGAIYTKYLCKTKIQNCTFVMNSANSYGGGLFVFYVAEVDNSIFWGNEAFANSQIWGSPSVSYSCIQGGYDGVGNIDVAPNFIDADAGDFHLQAGSPCIDAGTNVTDPPLLYGDMDGNPRRIDDPNTQDTGYGRPPLADMGAYEYQPPAAPNTNNPPQVNAGTDKIAKLRDWLDLSDAAASDEEPLTLTWTKTEGPDNGHVLFDPNNRTIHPKVWFSEPGQYTLQLEADDGQLSASDTLTVTVVRVSAGRSQTIRLPQTAHLDASLDGAAPVSVLWEVVPQYSAATDVGFSDYSISDYDPNAAFTAPGTYVLRITAEFAGFEGMPLSDETIVTVLPDPANPDNNAAPAVRAWADPNTITWPANTTHLVGRVWDDGLPDGRLSVQWKSGYSTTSGSVTFGTYSVANPDTSVTFSRPGTYELILTADDGAKQTTRPVIVQVLPANIQPDNGSPVISAGGDQTIHRSPFTPFTITLGSSVSDQTPTGILSIQWTVLSDSQGALAISDPTAVQPQITFFQTGTWTLLLTVSDGQYTATDQATITVTTDPIESVFEITAGADKTITLPAYAQLEDAAVTVANSNDPYPLDGLLIEWSKVTGPGEIEFFIPDDTNHPAPHTELNPSVRFSKAGNYTLQLVVSDTDSALLDEVQITVKTGRRIATHVFGSYVIDDYDTVWSAGANHYGQLGNGVAEPEYQFYFNQVSAGAQGQHPYLNNIESIAAGWIHSLALDKDQILWAFGAGNAGSLGTGDEVDHFTPVKVHAGQQPSESAYLENIVSIGAGSAHSLAVDADGYVWAWGYNNAGQLGNGQCRKESASWYKEAWTINRGNGDLLENHPIRVGSPNTELKVYYKFDEILQTGNSYPDTIFDLSGNHHTGHLQETQHDLTEEGIVGNAMIFHQNDETILGRVPSSDPNYNGVCGSQSRTISFWIKHMIGWNYPTGTLVAWGSDDQDGAAWEIKCIDGILGVYVSADNFDHKIQTVDPVDLDNSWHHVVVLLPEGKTTLQDIQIWTGTEGQPIEKQDMICPVQDTLEIRTGSEYYAVIGDTYFDPNFFPDPNGLIYHGLLDELQIYSRGLSEWEINYLHSNPDSTVPLRNICAVDSGVISSVALESMNEQEECSKGRVYTFGYDEPTSTDFVVHVLPFCVKGGEQGTDYLQNIVQISSSWFHVLALEKLDEDPESPHRGRVYAWGDNGRGVYFARGDLPFGAFEPWFCSGGRVGRKYCFLYEDPNDVNMEYIREPVIIYGSDMNKNGKHDAIEGYLENIIAVSAGESHSLALDKSGHLWAWGSNFFGQLGVNRKTSYAQDHYIWFDISPQFTPELVAGPDLDGDGSSDGYLGDHSPIVAIKAGPWHSLAMDAEGNVWAWGAPWAIGAGEWEILDSLPFDNFAFYPQPVKWQGGRVKRYSQGVLAGTYDAIRPAVEDADPNSVDEIIVYPGVYNEHVCINNKSVILRSIDPNNPEIVKKTIIDGCNIARYVEENRIDSVILIDNQGQGDPIGAQIIISGFTIRNAQYGVRVASCDPDMIVTISKNRIQNTATGILSKYDGFDTNQIHLVVRGNIVENNSGTGIYISSIESAVLEKNIIRANGDSLYISADQVLIKNNLICENGPMEAGHSIKGTATSQITQIIGNTIANNSCPSGSDYEVFDLFRNNILWGNSGDPQYSNLYNYPYNCFQKKGDGDPNFANLYDFWITAPFSSGSTINTNGITSGFQVGDVIECIGDGIPRIVIQNTSSSIQFHPALDSVPSTDQTRFIFNWGQPEVLVTQTDAAGGEDWLHVADANNFHIGDVIRYGNDSAVRVVTEINASDGSVKFSPSRGSTQSGIQVINFSAYLDQMNLVHDYHLTSSSTSCINKGDENYDPEEGETDLDGYARILDGRVDIGAYEYSPYTVSAGADKEIRFGELANMADAEVWPAGCSFQWVLLSKPVGSAYPLNQSLTSALNPVFELDALGQYTFKLSAYEGTQLVGADTVTVLVGLSVDANTGAPYEATLTYDPSSGLCSASVELVGRVRGANPQDIQILWGDPDYSVSSDPTLWLQGDSLYTSKNITFYRPGTYVIPLEVFDLWGRPLASDTAVVIIHAPAFEVDAGPVRQIDWADPSVTIQLCGKVIGYPVDQVDLHWRQISGPDKVVFDPALDGDLPRSGIVDPDVTFPQPGLYEFQFVADHGLERRVDSLQILVGRGVLLSAGEDLYGRLTNGQALVKTEHAYVYPNDGTLTIQWYCNGQIVDGATWPSGTFRFDTAGDYELTLHVSDAQQTWSDSVMVHIYQLPSGDPGQSLYINPGQYQPVVLEDGYAHLWLDKAFYHAQTGQVLSCRWSLAAGPNNAEFVQSSDGGQTSTILNPDVIFTQDDTYWLKLEVLNSQDTVIGSAQTCVVVLPEGTPPPTSGPDQTPPTVKISAVQDGADITGRTLTCGRIEITARAVDSGSGLQAIQLYLDELPLTYVVDSTHYPANLDLHYTLEVVGLSLGEHTLKAQAWDRIPNSGLAELVFDVNVPTTGQPPIAAILNLKPDMLNAGTQFETESLKVIETGFFELHGLAWHPQISDQNVRYKLDLYGQSGQTNSSNDWNYVGPVRIVDKAWQVDGFYHGQVRPESDCFGQIDLTGCENGIYELRLTVQVPGPYGDWLSGTDIAQFVLDSPLKIGQVKFTQEDLVIPVGGLPLRILRTYNSFQRHQDGPFGHGWTYTKIGRASCRERV
jgi:alpha-tubulin suppressor-like RCC1 family protein